MRKRVKSEAKTRPHIWPLALLFAAMLFAAVVRARLLQIPLERDEGEFAYMGQLMLKGIAPYKAAFNMKMPGIYAAYALIMAVFGQSVTAVHLGLLIANLASIALLFAVGRRVFGVWAGAVAAAGYAVLSVSPIFLGTQAHATHFVVVFALAGLLALMKGTEQGRGRWFLLAGFLFGLSFLMKQPGAVFGVFGLLYVVWTAFANKLSARAAAARILSLALGAAAPVALTVLLLWKAGVLNDFWFWTFTYLREYASQKKVGDAWPEFAASFKRILPSTWPLILAGFTGLAGVLISPRLRGGAVFAAGFFVFSFLAVCPGFYFRPHYYVLWLPGISMLAGAAAVWISGMGRKPGSPGWRSFAAAALIGFALLFTVWSDRLFLFVYTPREACRMMYPTSIFPESQTIAEYVRRNTKPDDRIAVLGSEPQIYFYADRVGAIKYIYMFPLMENHPYAARMQRDLVRQLESARPKYIVFAASRNSWMTTEESKTIVLDWVEYEAPKRYVPVGQIDVMSPWLTEYRWDREAAGRVPESPISVTVFKLRDE